MPQPPVVVARTPAQKTSARTLRCLFNDVVCGRRNIRRSTHCPYRAKVSRNEQILIHSKPGGIGMGGKN